jgi:hypothetical protein
MRRAVTFASLALVLALAGCAAAPAPAKSAPPGAAMEAGTRGGGAHDEIVALDGRILEWRRELGLGPEPGAPAGGETMAAPDTVPDRCRDVCILADYICQAADDICRLAGDLPGDAWAQGKCDKARASCGEARGKCADCARGAASQ